MGLGLSLQEIHNTIRKCSIGDSSLSYTKLFSDLPIEWEWTRPDIQLTRGAPHGDAPVVCILMQTMSVSSCRPARPRLLTSKESALHSKTSSNASVPNLPERKTTAIRTSQL